VRYAPQEQAAQPGRGEGVGEGRDALGDPAWIAYVRDRSVAAQLPAQLGGRPVVPEVSGEIDILLAR
jgi:hypothetical protein